MEVKSEWKRLEDQAAQHLNHLQEALNFFQFSTETDDLVAWLQDAYRLVSSEDFGHDEYSTQSLLKKHRGVSEAIDKHRLHVVTLRKHMVALPLQYREQEVGRGKIAKMLNFFVIKCFVCPSTSFRLLFLSLHSFCTDLLLLHSALYRRFRCVWERWSSCTLR